MTAPMIRPTVPLDGYTCEVTIRWSDGAQAVFPVPYAHLAHGWLVYGDALDPDVEHCVSPHAVASCSIRKIPRRADA